MRIMRFVLAAVFAVLALGTMAVSSASAFHPLFLTASGKTLLFTALGVDPTLRAEQAGVIFSLLCEKLLIHGFILHNSTLAHLLKLIFHGKCTEKFGTGGNETCTEPVETKPVLAELGLLTSTNHKVVLLLVPPDGTTNFINLSCAANNIIFGGVIVGEIPATNAKLENQINVARTEFEAVFATLNKTNHQSITEIFLLGSQMTKQELTAEGLIGGPASWEFTVKLESDGPVTICTLAFC